MGGGDQTKDDRKKGGVRSHQLGTEVSGNEHILLIKVPSHGKASRRNVG